MKSLFITSAWALALAANSAFALTVSQEEVANKVREVTLQEVVHEGEKKVVIADINGISLYTFDRDSEGKSVCNGGCLKVWPPLSIADDAATPAPFGKIRGNDGKMQLTLNGLPLYYFMNDKVPGDTKGHYPDWQLIIVK